ncbi:hypothetical protein [Helicobacter sp. MIT 14-3879]|uniref:hypothetical protein n=1 Tax=Helicobacter sp. MIT 14-3879 TaxID=2040649 RepID=UPI000E1F1D77|nr:hypothetical protein [Helicobacter sp. MIT 14-3879]RDU60205.1 hypothetical protein CQA44_10805 [Helicobacter sp. MIT 14-3879]
MGWVEALLVRGFAKAKIFFKLSSLQVGRIDCAFVKPFLALAITSMGNLSCKALQELAKRTR